MGWDAVVTAIALSRSLGYEPSELPGCSTLTKESSRNYSSWVIQK